MKINRNSQDYCEQESIERMSKPIKGKIFMSVWKWEIM